MQTGLPEGLSIDSSGGLISGSLTTEAVTTSTVTVDDGNGGTAQITFTWSVSTVGGGLLSFDFESDQQWTTNAGGTDSASTGRWGRSNPSLSVSQQQLVMQPEEAADGSFALITDGRTGSSVGSFDIDNGVTSIRSPAIPLPNVAQINLSFSYFLAHLRNSSSDDYLRVSIVGTTTVTVFEKRGDGTVVEAVWQTQTVDISEFAGQTVHILVEAADIGAGSLIESGIDNVAINVPTQ